MSKTKFFTISMTPREQLLGWLYLIFQVTLLPKFLGALLLILCPQVNGTVLNLSLFALNFLVTSLVFRRFWMESIRDLSGRLWQVFWKAGLALLLCKAGSVAVNFLLFLCFPQYFTVTGIGPVLQNVNDAALSQIAREQYLPMAIATVFLVPPVEEALHRGAVFASLYSKSPVLAYAVSSLLFGAVHILPYWGSSDPFYIFLCFLQYIPPALALCWLYAGTGSIFAPVIMHMLFNAIGILSVR